MAGKSAREVALDALTAWQAGGVWSARKLSDAIVKAGLDRRDAALTTYLCSGVLRNLMLLDYHIARHSSVKLKKMETRVLCALRLGAFQLLFSDSIPRRAAVNETVALCRGKNRRVAGFVNAVLRAMTSIDDPYEVREKNQVKRLSIMYSHPEWICRELIEALGEERAIDVLAANNEAPPVTIQINTLLKDSSAVADTLAEEGVKVEPHSVVSNCFNLYSSAILKTWGHIGRDGSGFRTHHQCLQLWHLTRSRAIKFLMYVQPGGKSFAAAVLSGGEGDNLI